MPALQFKQANLFECSAGILPASRKILLHHLTNKFSSNSMGFFEKNYVMNDLRNNPEVVDVVLITLKGSFGAFLMVILGIATIIFVSYGTKDNRRNRWILCVACGSLAVIIFIIRSLTSVWFNDNSCFTC
jgi:hypothetical protein